MAAYRPHRDHKTHGHFTRIGLVILFILAFVAMVAAGSNATTGTEPLLIAASVSSQIASDAAYSILPDWGIVSTTGKLYRAYLFVVQVSLCFSGVIVFAPQVIGLEDETA
ncbi:hypothetical protein BCR33DRAFT_715916 [Rhizoclosmatium globosum]|uniref:Uncharacterized protein n=1 Tax=Rhizoclosmatium globosum TaxID=329046 RepID=A0A1Y2CFP1_9FUNG|nr:hypothetical protein HDU99_003052 [Rhizoclosmatium hyalinum]KAJ3298296.1 hypothetical protein HDU79_011583 [Rhizoclosmatium sp. JEL0117]ORY45883.1 hypothetical protein BCR33DRAFT_715916 [Rhizoclosmatium globosum]|eukprot:ORY45883.1 hypothetical protein BCR33DRAFT_715916 [Rhizoclosmatium globosum]